MALRRKAIPSPNFSSRGGSKVRLIVLHTAEGARTIDSLGAFFKKPDAQVSSHVGIDDEPGVIGEYVMRGNKAWTAVGANPVAVQAELCAFAKWSRAEWLKHPAMLANTAKWIAEEAKAFGLPIRKLTAAQAQDSGRGVCQHSQLGSWGGGHWDCGPGFPIDHVLEMAAGAEGGGGEEEMGYPDWFWRWLDWHLNTPRDPKAKPKGVPAKIPDWAREAEKRILALATRYGMSPTERKWIAWYIDTPRKGSRPKTPKPIPPRWWDDEAWALKLKD